MQRDGASIARITLYPRRQRPTALEHHACVRVVQDKGSRNVHTSFVRLLSSRLTSEMTNYIVYVGIFGIHTRYVVMYFL